MKPIISGIMIVSAVFSLCAAESSGTDKTLVVWIAPADLTNHGGSAFKPAKQIG